MASFWNVLGRAAGSIVGGIVGGPGGAVTGGQIAGRLIGPQLPTVRQLPGDEGDIPAVIGSQPVDPGPWRGSMVPASCQLGPMVAAPATKQIAQAAAPGHVIVECNGQKLSVHRAVARHFGWKPKKKPPISVTDWQSLRRADRTVKKLDRVVKMSNAVVGKNRMTRSARRGRC